MFSKNVTHIVNESNKNKWKLLDIGGWYIPFNRADYVVDILPYKLRGFGGSQGGDKEYFTEDTWIVHNVSSDKPLPFQSKSFDFVICSHILEDIANPFFLIKEMQRVAYRGYIEVPSMFSEMSFGVESERYCGYYHHRWLIAIKNKKLVFYAKTRALEASWRYHFPYFFYKRLPEHKKVSWLYWNDTISASEIIEISHLKIQGFYEAFVRKHGGYPEWRYLPYNIGNALKSAAQNTLKSRPKLTKFIQKILRREIKFSATEDFLENIPTIESTYD